MNPDLVHYLLMNNLKLYNSLLLTFDLSIWIWKGNLGGIQPVSWVQESLGPMYTPGRPLSVHEHFYNSSLESSLVISCYPIICETLLGVP